QQGQVCSSGQNPSMKESNRTLDEVFKRISLQNREFSLIIGSHSDLFGKCFLPAAVWGVSLYGVAR
ncbi:hypothetical protein AALD74_23850, partial [Lachnospiraceae bacterium 48-21]